MNENTRKYYVLKGEEFEKASNYKSALASYLEAFSVSECLPGDEDYFKPGYMEDRIAFLAYRVGDYRTALTFGGKAHKANPGDARMTNNLPFYKDALLFTNPKNRIDSMVVDYINKNFQSSAKILDVGPYDGRWGTALNNYYVDGVEVFEEYLNTYNLRSIYKNVFVSDIRTFDFDYYDIIILGDVLEHMPVEDAQKLLARLAPKCKQIIIIIPYEYPQDEYDNNQYQIHYQEDLTDKIFKERYPGYDLFIGDEVRGAYIKSGSYDNIGIILPEVTNIPKTIYVGLEYMKLNRHNTAIGVFSDSLEEMSNEFKAFRYYNNGICYSTLEKTMEALMNYTKAVETEPNYRSAYFEIFKIFEKLEFWEDMELYLKKALEHINDPRLSIDGNIDDWKAILLIQLTLALSKQKKTFESYGYAALTLDCEMSEDKKKIAEYNFNELKKELWSTLQL